MIEMAEAKYNLRLSSLRNRTETERRQEDAKEPKEPKARTRPAPLSRYRRKTANARERTRMKDVNAAFDDLRRVIPQLPADRGRATKITTLNLALNYIKALMEELGYPTPDAVAPSPAPSSAGSSDGSSVAPGSGLDSEGESWS
jgi:bHLH factor